MRKVNTAVEYVVGKHSANQESMANSVNRKEVAVAEEIESYELGSRMRTLVGAIVTTKNHNNTPQKNKKTKKQNKNSCATTTSRLCRANNRSVMDCASHQQVSVQNPPLYTPVRANVTMKADVSSSPWSNCLFASPCVASPSPCLTPGSSPAPAPNSASPLSEYLFAPASPAPAPAQAQAQAPVAVENFSVLEFYRKHGCRTLLKV
jgi:hypothetical protein